MIAVLGFEFFRNALLAGLLASIACGLVGSYIVVKQMVSVSGGISHAAFGGIGLGYFLGIDPLLGAAGFTVATALGMGWLRQHARQNLDTLIGAVWATGMAIGILFIYLTPGFAPDLFSYLFGNILLVSAGTVRMMVVLVLVIGAIILVFYNPLLAMTFDEEYAEIMNLPTRGLDYLLLTLIALTVVMLIQVVGIILVIALLALPAATARLFASRLKFMMALSVLLGAVFTTAGIWLSYILDIPSGATIILVSAAIYAGAIAFHEGRERREPERLEA